MTVQPRFLLITYPLQGHINPVLQFAKHLIRQGASVTFVTAISGHRRMTKKLLPEGLTLAPYSDGYDDGVTPGNEPKEYMSEFRRRSSQAMSDLIEAGKNEGRPFTCLVYTFLLPWSAEVAREHHVPFAFLWIQPATVFDIYYYYFSGHGDMFSNLNDPSYAIELPGLLPLLGRDLPSFLFSSNTYGLAIPYLREMVEQLSKESKPRILVNTFDALEPEPLKALNLTAVGPLIPSAFLDGKDPSDTSFGGDLFQNSNNYTEWLDSKPNSSVIYMAFGSMAVLSKPQMEEIARALLDSGHPFLWVVREEQNGKEEKQECLFSRKQELEQQGMLVPWCSQLEVLSHPSLGCFVTHCGWNSTLESLASGVPVVTFPQWSDQATNAKLVEDAWKTGVRVVANSEGIVEGSEIKRCLDLVMGSEEMRMNAKKWKDLAREAVMEGGSSDQNLKAFMDELRDGCLSNGTSLA